MTVSTTVQVPRQGVIVPALSTFSTPMVLQNTTCDYTFYSAEVPVTLAQTTNSYFDVINGDREIVDAFHGVNSLTAC
jgi:hypothetical protein